MPQEECSSGEPTIVLLRPLSALVQQIDAALLQLQEESVAEGDALSVFSEQLNHLCLSAAEVLQRVHQQRDPLTSLWVQQQQKQQQNHRASCTTSPEAAAAAVGGLPSPPSRGLLSNGAVGIAQGDGIIAPVGGRHLRSSSSDLIERSLAAVADALSLEHSVAARSDSDVQQQLKQLVDAFLFQQGAETDMALSSLHSSADPPQQHRLLSLLNKALFECRTVFLEVRNRNPAASVRSGARLPFLLNSLPREERGRALLVFTLPAVAELLSASSLETQKGAKGLFHRCVQACVVLQLRSVFEEMVLFEDDGPQRRMASSEDLPSLLQLYGSSRDLDDNDNDDDDEIFPSVGVLRSAVAILIAGPLMCCAAADTEPSAEYWVPSALLEDPMTTASHYSFLLSRDPRVCYYRRQLRSSLGIEASGDATDAMADCCRHTTCRCLRAGTGAWWDRACEKLQLRLVRLSASSSSAVSLPQTSVSDIQKNSTALTELHRIAHFLAAPRLHSGGGGEGGHRDRLTRLAMLPSSSLPPPRSATGTMMINEVSVPTLLDSHYHSHVPTHYGGEPRPLWTLPASNSRRSTVTMSTANRSTTNAAVAEDRKPPGPPSCWGSSGTTAPHSDVKDAPLRAVLPSSSSVVYCPVSKVKCSDSRLLALHRASLLASSSPSSPAELDSQLVKWHNPPVAFGCGHIVAERTARVLATMRRRGTPAVTSLTDQSVLRCPYCTQETTFGKLLPLALHY